MTAPTPPEPSSTETAPELAQRTTSRVLATVLTGSGLLTIAVGIALGVTVDPLLYLIALVGLFDFLFAWLFASGRIGPGARQRRDALASGQAAQVAETDPSFNPYARED